MKDQFLNFDDKLRCHVHVVRQHLLFLNSKSVPMVQPSFVVMENVPGILTLSGGAFYPAIVKAFSESGYPDVSVAVLESADYGVPQLRPRAIFIANRNGWVNPYPKPQLSSDNYQPMENAISDLSKKKRDREINHEWTRHSAQMIERISKVQPGESLYDTYADAWKRQYRGKPCMTIKENHGGTHIHPYLDRVISAREMARLQTFPDQFFFCGPMKKAMWQIGNAVPPRLAEVIGKALTPSLQAMNAGQADPNPILDTRELL
ncbi:MAG: DNA cytosine methyltransferase [Verrucomicrobiales bacterium]|nr:DNA cytosine methyltransferase [Verrucomicrobiales bacterium]